MCRTDKYNLTSQIFPLKKKQINLLFWNIHGQNSSLIGDKFLDDDFIKICNNYDILGLAEMHTESTPSIDGFKLLKQKIRKKNS